MTFAALLTKELRVRLRRERSIWVLIIYVAVMGFLGFLFISRSNSYNSSALSTLGITLYTLFAFVQLFLILFITPAFTATSINGEKERQTFDLLLCSRLSAFALIMGKLLAGLANALLLIAASIPLFSLVFFFGGLGPEQVLSGVVVFVATTVLAGTFGLFCSTLIKRPQVSTAVAYMFSVAWVIGPWLLSAVLGISGGPLSSPGSAFLFSDNAILAMLSTLPFFYNAAGGGFGDYTLFGTLVSPWVVYTVINIVLTAIFVLLSMWLVKPNPMERLRTRVRKLDKATVTIP